MKIINTANGKILSEVITNHRMSIEEALEAVGIDLSTCDDEGAYRDNDGELFWLEDCEEADEAEYTRDDESEGWEFSAGSNYYEREADNTPMSDKGKRSL